jgi:anti-sigma-K factor RskA
MALGDLMRSQRRNQEHEEELAAFADGSLAPERRATVEERVRASAELADRLAEQERSVALVQAAVEGVEAPSSLRARIEARHRARHRRAPRRYALIGAAATAVAAGAAVLVVLLASGPSSQSFQAALRSPQAGSAATGEATLTKTDSGWRIELDTTGLPRLANGRFYQAWLKNAADVLVPVGSFNEGRNVTLWAGVSPVDFPTISITRERADGDQASSGDKVLVGTVDTNN